MYHLIYQDPPRAETPIFAFTGKGAGNVLKPELEYLPDHFLVPCIAKQK
jgi:hypothetical protein